MRPRDYESFKTWLASVNRATLTQYRMSIYELDDDIPRDILEEAFDAGWTPEQFVKFRVTPIFWPENTTR